ncbi:hypothetical protein BKA83DRAFT_4300677 [Pisolithus microcarpus]|nr:hypothetical protein BKA83DRAFT_4300677 [Pisolithus microcarpus]
MECIIYMGTEDARRQALNVFRMKMLGAKVYNLEFKSNKLLNKVYLRRTCRVRFQEAKGCC